MPEPPKEWDPETAENIRWLEETQPPDNPFQLDQGRTVTGPVKFWQSLKNQIAAGPDGARARNGVLQRDLRLLRKLFGGADGPEMGDR